MVSKAIMISLYHNVKMSCKILMIPYNSAINDGEKESSLSIKSMLSVEKL